MFEPGLIEKLQAKYPQINVSELSRGCETALNPSAALTAKCNRSAAAENAKKTNAEASTDAPQHAGYWNTVGQWIETGNEDDYWQAPAGSITRGVRKLVFERKNNGLTPKRAALAIEAHHLSGAFPNYESWLGIPTDLPVAQQWVAAKITTSAEAALKFRGEGGNFKHEPDGKGGVTQAAAKELIEQFARDHDINLALALAPPPSPPEAPKGDAPVSTAHHPRCTCEICFAPYHEWAVKIGLKG